MFQRRTTLKNIALTLLLLLLFSAQHSTALATHTTTTKSRFVHSSKNNMSSLKQRKAAGYNSNLSTVSAATTSADDNDENKEYKMASTKALQSMRACYKTLLFATFADIFTSFVDNDLYHKFYSPDGKWNWVDYVDVFDSMSTFVLACGIWRLSVVYNKMNDDNGILTNDRLIDIFKVMIWIWGINSWSLGMVSVSVAASLPAHGRGGPLDFVFSTISSKALIMAATGILVISNFAIRWYCNEQATVEDEKDNARIHPSQERSKRKDHIVSSRELAYQAYLQQCLCSGSFGMFSIVRAMQWIVDADDGGIVGRLLSCSDVLEPFAVTALLLGLNRSFLRASIARLREDSSNSWKDDDEVYKELFVAQSGFYTKVATVLQGTTIFQLLPYLVAPFVPFLSRIVVQLFPSIHAKAVALFA